MSGKRTVKTIEEREEEIPEPTEPDEKPEPKEEESDLPPGIAELFEVAQSGGRLEISRVPPGGGQPRYLTSVDPGMFSLEWLKDNWGGGKYYIRAKGGDGRYAGHATIAVEGRPRSPRDDEEEEDKGRGGRRLTEDAMVMAEMIQTLRAIRDDIRNPPAAAQQGNPMEMALSMVTAMQEATRPFLERLLEDRSETPSAMEQFSDFLELAERLGVAPGGDSVASVVRPLIQPLADRLRLAPGASYNPEAQPVTPGATNPNPPPANAHRDPETPPGERPPAWVHHVRPIVAQLLPFARHGRSPEVYAEVVLDQLETVQGATEFLQSCTSNLDVFLPDFFSWNPEARDYRDWFTELWTEMGHSLGTIPFEGDDDGEISQEAAPDEG